MWRVVLPGLDRPDLQTVGLQVLRTEPGLGQILLLPRGVEIGVPGHPARRRAWGAFSIDRPIPRHIAIPVVVPSHAYTQAPIPARTERGLHLQVERSTFPPGTRHRPDPDVTGTKISRSVLPYFEQGVIQLAIGRPGGHLHHGHLTSRAPCPAREGLPPEGNRGLESQFPGGMSRGALNDSQAEPIIRPLDRHIALSVPIWIGEGEPMSPVLRVSRDRPGPLVPGVCGKTEARLHAEAGGLMFDGERSRPGLKTDLPRTDLPLYRGG